MPTRSEILDEAKRIITKDRAATHGNPENSFALIADLWSAYLGIPVCPLTVCHMMTLLKIARAKGNPTHLDSFVDACGYEAIAGELASRGGENAIIRQPAAQDAANTNH